MKYFLDTNVFLRFFLGDIPLQKKQFEKLLNQAKKAKIILLVPQIVIFEITFILDKYYHLSKQEIIDKLKPILTASYLQVQDRAAFNTALEIYGRSQKIAFVDCFLLAKAQLEKAEIFTFDKKLEKLKS